VANACRRLCGEIRSGYGPALAWLVGCLHCASTEAAAVWNGKMEGALLAAKRAGGEVATALDCDL
jgi:monoamine oxidase